MKTQKNNKTETNKQQQKTGTQKKHLNKNKTRKTQNKRKKHKKNNNKSKQINKIFLLFKKKINTLGNLQPSQTICNQVFEWKLKASSMCWRPSWQHLF